MRYRLIFTLLTILYSINSLAEGLKMGDNNFFTISVSCNDQKECLYKNQNEIPIVVNLKNIGPEGFYLPLEYIKKSGPSVKLVDRSTQRNMPLKPNLASWDLKKNLFYIPRESNVSFTWTILDSELAPFIKDGAINIDAEFKVRTKIYNVEKNEIGDFISSSNLVIKGDDLDENKR